MDAFRKQLDALMGASRNGDVLEVKWNYWDRNVCRLYLTGLCPHDLFQLTGIVGIDLDIFGLQKMDLGPYSKVHSLQLQKEYEEAKTNGKDNYDWDLEEPIIECDRKIQRALKRLEDDDAGAATAIAVSEVTKSAEASEYTRQIKEKLKSAEYLDLEGRSDDKIRQEFELMLCLRQRAVETTFRIFLQFHHQQCHSFAFAASRLFSHCRCFVRAIFVETAEI